MLAAVRLLKDVLKRVEKEAWKKVDEVTCVDYQKRSYWNEGKEESGRVGMVYVCVSQ